MRILQERGCHTGQTLDCSVLLGSLLQEEFLLSLKKDLTQLPAGGTGERKATAVPTNYRYPSLHPGLCLYPLPSPICLKQKGPDTCPLRGLFTAPSSLLLSSQPAQKILV